ncbi:hypothetical protein SynA15127_01505 [Synechococcus sp. A15-127]|nr:hypothetical protein SynA15127_01505 [Synechococcus sp. A15-127]
MQELVDLIDSQFQDNEIQPTVQSTQNTALKGSNYTLMDEERQTA